MPLVVLVLLVGVDGVLLARDQILVIHCAREGARRAALTGDPSQAEAVVRTRGAPAAASVSVSISGESELSLVRVTVGWSVADRLIVLGHLGSALEVEHTTVMTREPLAPDFGSG